MDMAQIREFEPWNTEGVLMGDTVWYHIMFWHQNRRKPYKRTEELWQCPECGRHNTNRFIEEDHKHCKSMMKCIKCAAIYTRTFPPRAENGRLYRVQFKLVNRKASPHRHVAFSKAELLLT